VEHGGWVGVSTGIATLLRYSIVFACILAGCAASPVGELGQQACTDGLDNDHDGRTDCDDTDCQNTICREPMNPAAHGMDAGPGSSGGTSAHPPPLPDAGRPLQQDAAPVTEDEDGSTSLPPPFDIDASVACMPVCAPTEECVDSACIPVAVNMSVQLVLTIDSAIASDTTPITQKCYDTDCPNAFEFGVCLCHIDPYVVVSRVRDGAKDQEIARTGKVSDQTTPEFKGTAITLDLSKGDALLFEVWDSNSDGFDTLLFSCKPDLSDPMPGPLNCAPPESNPLRPLLVKAHLNSL
jgi:hypothetical protein